MRTDREIERVRVGVVYVGPRHRTPSSQSIATLAESMEQIGLQVPILIRTVEQMEIDGNTENGVPVLVAGNTRLAAAKSLGWAEIDCIEIEGDEVDAELIEIAENLHRAELTALERSEQVARYAELIAAKAAQVEPPDARYTKGGDREASRQLNLSRGDVQRSKKVATLSAEAKEAAREIGLDNNRSAMLAAAKETDTEAQVAILRQRAEQRQRPVAPAPDPINDLEAREKQVAALMSAWNRASAEAREEFMRRVDRPAFDNTVAGRF